MSNQTLNAKYHELLEDYENLVSQLAGAKKDLLKLATSMQTSLLCFKDMVQPHQQIPYGDLIDRDLVEVRAAIAKAGGDKT
jgi:seryl-tRNA synthetase